MLRIYGVQSKFLFWIYASWSLSLVLSSKRVGSLGPVKLEIMISWWGEREHSASRPCLGVTKWNLGRSMREWTYFARQMCWGLKAKNSSAPKGWKEEGRASCTSPSFYGPAIIRVKKTRMVEWMWGTMSDRNSKQPHSESDQHFDITILRGAIITICRNYIK